VGAEHRQEDNRQERKIHAALGGRLGDDRNQARAWSENKKDQRCSARQPVGSRHAADPVLFRGKRAARNGKSQQHVRDMDDKVE
jgi:hypothetical protein